MNEIIIEPTICIAVGLYTVYGGFSSQKMLTAAKSWPKTPGVIIEVAIRSGFENFGNRTEYAYRREIRYEYTVNGRKYISSQLAVVETETTATSPDCLEAPKYSEGQIIDVFYDPQKPESAALNIDDCTRGGLPIGFIVVGIAITISGLIWLRFAWQ